MINKSILIVEDDFLNRRISKKTLVENGYTVFEAKNAKEAMEIVQKESLALIILDINLGENQQDGISMGQEIKDKYSIPFIYLTAYENPEIIEKAVATTPYSYLTKPFKKSDLIASVKIAISLSSNLSKRKPFIYVKDGEYSIELATENINYIESEGNYLLFYTDDKIYKCRSSIKNILTELSASKFVQTHRAYIINKNKIDKFSNKKVIIKGNSIPISDNYLDVVKQLI